MSGFLAGLAARSVGRARVVEPRRTVFEPGAEPLAEAQPPAPRTESVVVEPVTEPAPPARDRPAAELDEPLVPAPEPERPRRPQARRQRPQEPQPAASPARPVRTVRALAPRRSVDPSTADPVEPAASLQQRRVPSPAAPTRIETVRRIRETEIAAERPVVRVTIGRVEVRAVREHEQQPARREPPKPRLTLDEYLARSRT